MGNSRNFNYFHHPTIIIVWSSFTYIVYRQFTALFKSFGKILPNSPLVIKFIDVIGTICCSGVTFIEISIKDNKPLWYQSIHTIYRSFQDIWGTKIVKLRHFLQMQIFTHFCKIKPKYELEKTSKFKFNKGTIVTHSTIADRLHRVFLTFLTFLLSVVLALLTLSHNMCHLSSNQLLIQAICEKTVLEVLTHTFVLLKQYTRIEVNWLIVIS